MKNNLYTIGVEEEYMLCDPLSGNLIDKADLIMDSIEKQYKNRFSYELVLSEIESNTSVNDNLNDTIDEVSKLRNMLKDIGQKNNFSLGISGTHPTAMPNEQNFVNNESYNWVKKELKHYASKNITFSVHVHIGLDDKEKLVHVTNSLRRWISPMLALTTNSPFFEGVNTGMKSSRTFQFGLFPRTGIPPFIDSYKSFEDIIYNYTKSKSIVKPRHIWWKIRPHVDFNTVEFRVCDAQASLKKIEMIVGLLQALVRTIDIDQDFNLNYKYEYLTDSLWKAASNGLDSIIIDPLTNKIIKMKDMVQLMVDYCSKSLDYFDNNHIVQEINNITKYGTEGDMQLKYYKNNGMDKLKLFLIKNVQS